MEKLNGKSATPLYIQLTETIRQLISSGAWQCGQQILPENALCECYGVSRITVRKAIDRLVEEKVLFRRQGKGTFVSYPDFYENACMRDRSFTAATIGKNVTPYTRVIGKSVTPVSAELAAHFHMAEDHEAEMIRLIRIRYLDEKAVVYETDYLPMRFQSILELDLENRSLYGTLHEKMGVDPENFCDSFRIVAASQHVAELLSVPAGQPLLSVVQTVLDGKLAVVYYNEQLIETDRYHYVIKSYVD